MASINSERMYGVIDGVYICGIDKEAEINRRCAQRNVPSTPLAPSFSCRPVSTKYATMPILDQRAKSNVPLKQYEPYNTSKIFNPAPAGPWCGFASHINEESKLRNQFFALQKCEQSEYVPSSDSDLYVTKLTSQPVQQPFPDLFKQETFAQCSPNTNNLGGNLFDNCTRQQTKQV